VDWTPPQAPGLPGEGLRERKKRLMRQQLSDTATAMFLERGFDGVRVAEVAAACGVSEKTAFNYFAVKEALVMDRLEATLTALTAGLSDPGLTPVQAVLEVLDHELGAMTGWLAAQEDATHSREAILRFGDLVRATPALRAYQADMTDQAATAAAGLLAVRAGMTADDPEPQIAARALLGKPVASQAGGAEFHVSRICAPKTGRSAWARMPHTTHSCPPGRTRMPLSLTAPISSTSLDRASSSGVSAAEMTACQAGHSMASRRASPAPRRNAWSMGPVNAAAPATGDMPPAERR
jgi:AcrR family transcriptional regulator